MQKKRLLAITLALVFVITNAIPAFAGITSAPTPRDSDEAQLRWQFELRDVNDWGTGVSSLIYAHGSVFAVAGDTLFRICAETGQEQAQLALAEPINFTSRPHVAGLDEGPVGQVIYIPLSNGRLQAVDMLDMISLWVTDPLPAYNGMEQQSLSSVSSYDGQVFFGTAAASWTGSYFGTFMAVNEDGSIAWYYINENAGYYWAGADFHNDTVFIAGDDGVLMSFDWATGAVIDTLALGAPVRASVVVDRLLGSDNHYVFVNADGTFHRVALNANGTFGTHTSLSFTSSSVSTPTIVHNHTAWVGGMDGIVAIDTRHMEIRATITTRAPVQSSPLFNLGTSLIYFTVNDTPGALYMSSGQIFTLFTPAEPYQNFCIASPIAGSDGTLFYTNDSGQLFAVERIDQPGYHNGSTIFSTRFADTWYNWLLFFLAFGWVWMWFV